MTSESAYVIEDVPQVESTFEKLVNSDGFKKVSAFFELFDFILKNPKEELGRFSNYDESPKNEKFNRVIEYLRDHFREELTVESIAEDMSMSPYQLRTMFKKQTYNKSVLQYLNELRVFEACRLMQNDEYTISYLSGLAGFNNLSYFNRIFLKVTGKTPREYRKVFC
ncbi:MAG: AraC family transcriptional regulator [Lentisphaerales bacterium]|nr:AraC family transcriptional regulator [Lentisphaerales bacterium]